MIPLQSANLGTAPPQRVEPQKTVEPSIPVEGLVVKPLLVLGPRSGLAGLDAAEIWRYRGLLLTLATRDVKLRYKQTALGVLWVVLQPLIAAAIFAIVFGRVAGLPSAGVPYFVFSFAGLLAWNAFNSTLNKASASVVENAQLVSKVYFPRLILPLSTVLSTLIDFAVAMGLMIVLMAWYHVAPRWQVLWLPALLALFISLAIGIGMYAAALMVAYRDLRYVIPVLLQFLLYASPVAYSVSVIHDARLRRIFFANPLTALLEAFRWSLLGQGQLSLPWLGYSAAVSIFLLGFGAVAFRRMERKFADVV